MAHGVIEIDRMNLKLTEYASADAKSVVVSMMGHTGALGLYTTTLKRGGKREVNTTIYLTREQVDALRAFLNAQDERDAVSARIGGAHEYFQTPKKEA